MTILRRSVRRIGASLSQTLLPPACIVCGEDVSDPYGMCPRCWLDMKFVSGAICDGCGRPLDIAMGTLAPVRCLDCQKRGFHWERGRAAALYHGSARSLVLSLKHGDRPDLAPAMARWMVRAAADVLADADAILPVPLHRSRLVRRRLNQSAELSRHAGRIAQVEHAPGLLRRVRMTQSQKGRSYTERFRNVAGAFDLSPGGVRRLAGKRVVLVDDVMTTGATLNAASRVLLDGGVRSVDTLVFARVARDDAELVEVI